MFFIWVMTWVLAQCDVPLAIKLWHWYGLHPVITVLMILFLDVPFSVRVGKD